MTTHRCTCEECERRRQQAGDEAFADMVVVAQFHPEWFHFGEHHGHDHGQHDTEAFGEDGLEHDEVEHDGFHDGGFGDDLDDIDGFGLW